MEKQKPTQEPLEILKEDQNFSQLVSDTRLTNILTRVEPFYCFFLFLYLIKTHPFQYNTDEIVNK